MQKLDISNLMFSFSDGKLFRYGTRDGRIECDERLYLHLQKREISIETSNCEQFSVIPPGCIVKYRVPTYNYLKRNIRDGKFWTYYIRLINKFRSVMGISAYSNLVLLPSDNYYDKKYK